MRPVVGLGAVASLVVGVEMNEEMIRVCLPTCPSCKSFRTQSRMGDVAGRSCFDAYAAIKEAELYPQSFTTRHYSEDECLACGHRWNYVECDGLTLTLEARKPTILERVVGFFK